MKPRDIVHALERLEMELEGERMAREDVAGQYMRFVETQRQHADSTTAFETDALKHELARVQCENRSLRKKIMQICNAGRSAPTVVQNLLKASLKRPSEVAEGNVSEQEDRPPDHADRGECAKKSRAEVREHTETAQLPVRTEDPVAAGPQRQARHEGGWGVPFIKVETAVDGAGQQQPPARKREGGANVRRGAEARELGRPIAGDMPLGPAANSKSPEKLQEAAGTRGALKDIGNQPVEARSRGSSAAGDVASGKETEVVKPESVSPPVQEAKWTNPRTLPDEAWGLDDLGERSPGGRYPGERVYNEAVRNRDQRAAMPGHACHCCTNFLNAVHEDTAERQRIIQQCSKHRQYRRRYETPPQYWELDFLDEL